MSHKRVGILTFHRADNLGAVLQAFALQTTIENKCGAYVEIIDYKCSMIESTKHVKKCNSVKDLIKFPLMVIYYFIKRRGFERFRSLKLKQSTTSYDRKTISESAMLYDVVISGSDQVWNPGCSGSDYTYFLDYVPNVLKKISYAASIGTYKYNDSERLKISSLLEKFDALSVREKTAAEEISSLGINNNVLIHPDPVVLLLPEQWRLCMAKRLCNQRYVLVYLVLPDDKVMRSAQKYADKYGYKIINNKKSLEFIFHNSPGEFLSWVYYAECVFTNSFHGTAFSLIFNKPFAADIEMVGGGINNRVNDFLKATGAERCILDENDVQVCVPNSQDELRKMRESGIEYLKLHCK